MAVLRFICDISLMSTIWVFNTGFTVLESKVHWVMITASTVGPAADIVIALAMCYYLWELRESGSRFNRPLKHTENGRYSDDLDRRLNGRSRFRSADQNVVSGPLFDSAVTRNPRDEGTLSDTIAPTQGTHGKVFQMAPILENADSLHLSPSTTGQHGIPRPKEASMVAETFGGAPSGEPAMTASWHNPDNPFLNLNYIYPPLRYTVLNEIGVLVSPTGQASSFQTDGLSYPHILGSPDKKVTLHES
ncbi:hypothetical protein DFH09DRAFT_1096425 [Mycena vulgaris]|nr:hypothetical protein DFH09DRAFT_1096425 [Mycena vulgaris]